MYGDYTTTHENTTPVTEVRELENKVEEEEKMLEEKEKRLKAWGCNIDDREMALTQLAKKLEEREEKAVALITEVEKRKKVVEVVERRESKARNEDVLDTSRVGETQREQRPVTPPVHREQAKPVREGKPGETEVRQPTTHQLFVGNIPNDVDKTELAEFFEQFGKVLEVIINNVGKLCNFGFVLFEDLESVQQILSKRPITFRGNLQLNVEEIKGKKDGGGRKGVLRSSPTYTQKPSYDNRHGVGQEEEEKLAAATPNPWPSAEAEKAVKPAAMEEEQRLKAWRNNLVDWEMALKEMEAKLAEREERAKAKIIEVEKMKQKLLERENKAREKDSPDTTLIPETQRHQIPPQGPSPVYRETKQVFEGKQGDAQVRKPTAHQLFVGNVPHDVDRTELMEFFEQYGRVLELTIKSRGKQSNFGFVLFDSSEPVQLILSKGNILFRGNWHLNVEEIKARSSSKKAVVPLTHTQKPSVDIRQGAGQEKDKRQQEVDQQEAKQQQEAQQDEKESAVTANPGSLAEAEKVVVVVKPAAMEEEEKRLKSWGHNLDDWEMALREKEKNLVEREEKAKIMIIEVEKRKQKVVERENKALEKDVLETPAVPITPQRDPAPETPPVQRGPKPACDGTQGDSEITKPATHQLFVGKIPHNVEKAELTEFFEQFGRVLELIIIKNDSLPNFGFVMFDDLEPVQQILNNRPIKFRGNCRLNIEEMKPKSAMRVVSQSPTTYIQKPSLGSRQDAEPSVEAEEEVMKSDMELKTEPQPETRPTRDTTERKPTETPCSEPGVLAEKDEPVALPTPEPPGETKKLARSTVMDQKWPSVPKLKMIFEQEKILGYPLGPSNPVQKRVGSRQGAGLEEDNHKSPEPSVVEAEKEEPAVIKLKSPSVPKIKMFFEQFGQEVQKERKDKSPRTVPLR